MRLIPKPSFQHFDDLGFGRAVSLPQGQFAEKVPFFKNFISSCNDSVNKIETIIRLLLSRMLRCDKYVALFRHPN
jgi:hypothetical protein